MQIIKKILWKLFYFFAKMNFFYMTGSCIFEAKTQKQRIIRQNLLSNFYSTLNFLSSGIQYVKLFSFNYFSFFY